MSATDLKIRVEVCKQHVKILLVLGTLNETAFLAKIELQALSQIKCA